MARNQPYDFTDDDDAGGYGSHYTSESGSHTVSESGTHSGSSTSSPATYSTSTPSSPAAHGTLGANGLTSADMGLTGMGEDMRATPDDTGRSGTPPTSMSPAQEAAGAATKTAPKTSTKSSSSTGASPTSMAKKRGNQPR
ncbi:hypothetical protein [Virgisporangium ochraceum]|uniref:hypothetical protein n=1 Tax=Virgisporangium ochraceum TaxID=65505 RepID=UPI0019424563|nr:hypothetical protein [Virgisporangium ochraceum]